MATCFALVTVAVIVAVKASMSTFELGFVAVSGRTTVAVEAEGSSSNKTTTTMMTRFI